MRYAYPPYDLPEIHECWASLIFIMNFREQIYPAPRSIVTYAEGGDAENPASPCDVFLGV